MKKRFQQSFLLSLLLILGLPVWASQDGDIVLQEKWGRQVITVAADQEITFYDWNGTNDISSNSGNNSRSLTVFKPAVAGQSIQLTFESFDVTNDGTSWPGHVLVYSGDPDPEGTFTYNATLIATSTMPEGTVLEKLDGTYSNKTFISEDAEGVLSVGMLWRYAKACKGWVAKVKCVTLESQTVTGAGSNYDGVVATPAAKQNVSLANAYVTATGVINPDKVTAIHFSLPVNQGVVHPTALKLFNGDKRLNASVEADGDGYKFVMNENPVDGTTIFTIKADILGTAEVGSEVKLVVTKVCTQAFASGVTPFSAGTPVTVKNPAIVIMTSTPQTVSVGTQTLIFYDEGGADGGIQAKTNGQVTFLPAVKGQKVMVNFLENKIWHGSYYNQELRIYSGTEVKAANLVKTLQQGETGIVRSTSEDGALTVVLFSDAATTTAADGFKAEVSLFTPKPMTITTTEVTTPETATVAGGDTNMLFLGLNISTQDTEPAAEVTRLSFSAVGTSALADKAYVYFTGTDATPSTIASKLVGEATVESDLYVVTFTNPVTLTEGTNHFWLTLDISNDVANDQLVKAQAKYITATINGNSRNITVDNTQPTATRTVLNVVECYSGQGTMTRTVNGSMGFNTRPTSTYSSKYEYGTDTRTTIFVPKHEGNVVQIEFSEFAVYYGSSTYGTRAKFEIYEGKGTNGQKLYELNSNDDQNVGPQDIVRSGSADGALTVVFCPNTSYSSYTLDGWKATVSEYQSKPMEVADIEATHTTTDIVSIGSTDQDLLTISLTTEGDQQPLQATQFIFDLKDTYNNITALSLYYVGKKDLEPEGEPVGVLQEVNGRVATVTLSEPVTLREGTNFFRLKADINSNAQPEQTIDAALAHVYVGGKDIKVANGDPVGSRTLKSILLLQAGDNGMITLGDNPIMLYDDGGADGPQSTQFSGKITFAPSKPGYGVAIRFIQDKWQVSGNDYFYVYNGAEETETPYKEFGMYSLPDFSQPLTTRDLNEGKFTVKYTTKNYAAQGFAVEVFQYEMTNLEVTTIATEPLTTAESTSMRGQKDIRLQHIMVNVVGDKQPITIQKIGLTTENADIFGDIRVYVTDTLSSYSNSKLFAAVENTAKSIEGTYTVSEKGTYHFWLTASIKADAEHGKQGKVQVNNITVDGMNVATEQPAMAQITVGQGKQGTFTVSQTDNTANYASIQAAINDIATSGVEGPVVINVKAGEYNEQVKVPFILGTSEANTVTLQSESGSYNDVKIYNDRYVSSGYSSNQMALEYGVVTLDSVSYFTLKNIEVTTTDTSFPAVIMVKNQSRYCTIDGNYLHADRSENTQTDINIIGHYAENEANRNNDYLTVRNNLIEGGYIGVNMGGTSYVKLPKEVGGVIERNTFRNQGIKAIYCYDELGVKVRFNRIENTESTKAGFQGMDIVQREAPESGQLIVEGNRVYLKTAAYSLGINPRQIVATEDRPALFINNEVIVDNPYTSAAPLKVSAAGENVIYAHNTFRAMGSAMPVVFFSTVQTGNVKFINNIVESTAQGPVYNFYRTGNFDVITMQSNLLYTEGETFAQCGSNPKYASFANWCEASGETLSINKKPVFLSDDILEPDNTLDDALLSTIKLDYVATDINQTVRGEKPTIGAYEYNADRTRVPMFAVDYPKAVATAFNTAQVLVKADSNGRAYAIVKKATDEAPTEEEVKASEANTILTADTEASLRIEGLEELTEYVAYVLVESNYGVGTGVVNTLSFTTPMEPIDLMAVCLEPVQTVASGSEVQLKAMVASGLPPFNVSWIDAKHEPVGETITTELLGEEINLTIRPTISSDYILTITDAQQKQVSDTCRVVVTGEAITATFENLYLAENSHWNGPDTKGEDVIGAWYDEQKQGSFLSGSYAFSNNYSLDWGSWSGFSYANSKSNTFRSYTTDQWNASTAGGYKGSDNYAVFFLDSAAPMKIKVLNNADGDQLRGFYITNAAVTEQSILYGDGQTGETDSEGKDVAGSEGFRKTDFFYVTITADNGKTLDYYLADYRSDNADDHYYVNQWEWVDLSELGTVKELSFNITTSRKNQWGATTPLYFCIDNFNGEREITAHEKISIENGKETDLNELLGQTSLKGTAVYKLAEPVAATVKAEVALTADGKLTVSGSAAEELELLLSITRKGHTDFISLPIELKLPTGISDFASDDNSDSQRYNAAGQRTTQNHRGLTIIRQADGRVVKKYIK